MLKRSSKYPKKDSFKTFCDSKNIYFGPCIDPFTHSINCFFEHSDRDEYLDRLVSCFEFPLFFDEDIEDTLLDLEEVFAKNCEDDF